MDKKIRLMAALLMLAAGTASAGTWSGIPYFGSTIPASGYDPVASHAWTWTGTHEPEAVKAEPSALSPEGVDGSTAPFRTVVVYEGKNAIKKIYKLNMPTGAHWRVLWKVKVTEKNDPTVVRVELKSPSDPKYLQGITKEMMPLDGNAYGVINVCLTTGGEFTLDLNIDPCTWKIEVQRLN